MSRDLIDARWILARWALLVDDLSDERVAQLFAEDPDGQRDELYVLATSRPLAGHERSLVNRAYRSLGGRP